MKGMALTDRAELAAELGAAWRELAVCKGHGRLMSSTRPDDQAEARRLCWRCPALDDCRTWVMGLPAREDPHGVCGGLTYAQRKGHRARARIASKKGNT